MEKIFVIIRRYIYIILGIIDDFLKIENNLAVLSYHSFEKNDWKYSIDPEAFEKQVKILISLGYRILSFDEFIEFYKNKSTSKGVLITIDDGYKSILKIKKIIKKYNLKPIIFILSHPENANRSVLKTNEKLLSYKEILELKKLGCSIGSHSMTHSILTELKNKKKSDEIIKSKEEINKRLKINTKAFAYPRGQYDKESIDLVCKTYDYGFTMNPGIISRDSDCLLIPRAGVDRTHSLEEFRFIFSPSVILFKKIAMKFLGKLL